MDRLYSPARGDALHARLEDDYGRHEGFLVRYIAGRHFSTDEALSFLLGYYAHLHTDVLLPALSVTKSACACFARIRAEESYARAVRGLPETRNALKLASQPRYCLL